LLDRGEELDALAKLTLKVGEFFVVETKEVPRRLFLTQIWGACRRVHPR
jgi:hypothetical protein